MLACCAMLIRVIRTKRHWLPASLDWRLGAALAILAGAVLMPVGVGTVALASPAKGQTPALARAAAAAASARGAHGAAKTVVTFTWGGGFKNQVGALPVFRRYQMHATFYVPSGLVCQAATNQDCSHSPYLTLDQMHQIAADGNEIGGLTVEHVPLIGIPAAEAQREICNDRVNLTRWGFRVTDFAYPFALTTYPLQVLARRCGYNSGLGAGELRGAGLCRRCAWAETIPPRNPYLVRAPIEVASVGTAWSPATFEKMVTDARRHGGGWIIFTVHDVCARACPLGVTQPELSSVLGWLSRQAAHGVSVRTVRQVIGGPVRPAVAGPRSPRIPRPGVANSRLSAVTGAGLPVCFQASRYGMNRATFRYRPHAGPGGAGAELISLTQRKSGTAQLLPALDLGACAPTVSAGRSYTLGAWYESSQPVVFNAYYRTAAGAWTFWATSPPMPASRSWTQASWTPPTVPANASAVSFALALGSDGTLTTTRYSLAPVRYSYTRLIVFSAVVAALVVAVAARRLRHRRRRPGPGPGRTETRVPAAR